MLLNNTLAHPDHFAEHVRLVFKNAMEFNQEGSPVYIQALQCSEWFEPRYQQLIDRLYPIKGDAMDVEEKEPCVSIRVFLFVTAASSLFFPAGRVT